MLKVLENIGLLKVFQLLKKSPAELEYYVTLTEGNQYTFTIPSYVNEKSQVEIYKNGIRLVENTEYTLSSSGFVKVTVSTVGNNNKLHIIHRKYG